MLRLCFALPVLPGKTEAMKEFLKSRAGPRWEEEVVFEKQQKALRQTFWLQPSPQGDLLLIYGEWDAELTNFIMEFAGFQDSYARWIKEKFLEFTGVDFNKPQTLPPPPEKLLAYEQK